MNEKVIQRGTAVKEGCGRRVRVRHADQQQMQNFPERDARSTVTNPHSGTRNSYCAACCREGKLRANVHDDDTP